MQPPPLPSTPVSTVTCQWCSQPMNNTDIRCTHCGKLRKDIYSDKVRSYLFCLIGGLLIGISIALWKTNRRNEFEYFENTSSPDNTLNMVMLAVGIISGIVGTYFYVSASRKMKTWWWA